MPAVHVRQRLIGAVSTTMLALVLAPGATAAQESPDISVLFDDSLPAPGTTGDATFIVENLSDVDATFEGDIRFGDDDPAHVLTCESALAPPHADTEVMCTVESAADACDQILDLFMTYTWEGGPVEVSTTADGDFDGVGPCPQPSPPPAGPSGLQGSWAGTITIGNDADQPFTMTLVDCEQGFEPCGEITFRDETGVGCTFPLHFINIESMPEGVPPPQDDQLVYLVGTVCIECDDLWLGSMYLYVRQVDGGGLEIAPVWPEVLPALTVAPAPPPEPDPPYSFNVEPTTVRVQGTLAISVTGVSEAFAYLGYATGSQSLGELELDEAGSGTLVRDVPSGVPAGSAEVVLSGRLYASYCTVEDFSAINLVESDQVGGIPTPPATDTVVDDGRRVPAPVWLLGSVLLGTLAGCFTLRLQRRRLA